VIKCILSPELEFYRRRLPHLRLEQNVYFVTWRLHKNQPGLSPEERDLVFSAIKHFNGERYQLYAYVVMDDHVHVLFRPEDGFTIKKILHSWKSFTGHELVKKCKREAPVWQDEYFDRIVRSEAELYEKAAYILYNPRKRWSEIEDYKWVGLTES
jgi:REP element-mobilizing transposase RayT